MDTFGNYMENMDKNPLFNNTRDKGNKTTKFVDKKFGRRMSNISITVLSTKQDPIRSEKGGIKSGGKVSTVEENV
jgi:hypothetical protein